MMPDALPMVLKSRVTVSEYPEGIADIFPPMYNKDLVGEVERPEDSVPIISMGRYGSLFRFHKPSDDAIVAMIDSAKKIVRLALQDLGPGMLQPFQYVSNHCFVSGGLTNCIGYSRIFCSMYPRDKNYSSWMCVA